jgi:hypothetical protein
MDPVTVELVTWIWLIMPMMAIGFWSAAAFSGEARPVQRVGGAVAPIIVAVIVSHVLIPIAFSVGVGGAHYGRDIVAIAAGVIAGWTLGIFTAARTQI